MREQLSGHCSAHTPAAPAFGVPVILRRPAPSGGALAGLRDGLTGLPIGLQRHKSRVGAPWWSKVVNFDIFLL